LSAASCSIAINDTAARHRVIPSFHGHAVYHALMCLSWTAHWRTTTIHVPRGSHAVHGSQTHPQRSATH
jgi:hypothetical protein